MKKKEISTFAQKCFEKCPTIVLGSGASIPHGLPSMDELRQFLLDKVRKLNCTENDAWNSVSQSLEKGSHLEESLEGKNLPETLLTKIVGLTWQCVNEQDAKLMYDTALNNRNLPLGKLLAKMFNSTLSEIHVVTTNYDRVAEYACNSKEVLYQTGFAPGYIQKWEGNNGIKYHRHMHKKSRVVKIWKVHGSLDWFSNLNEITLGLPVFEPPPVNCIPLIVTPGINKFEKTHQDPFRTIINGADKALSEASAFLCIGFGFRDQHIHPKIIERCRKGNVPIVVLAKNLTQEAKDFLKKKAGPNYLGIEKSAKGSFIYSSNHPNGVNVAEEKLWTLPGFNNLVL